MAPETSLSAFGLDDFDVRPGSATSILRTIAGLYLRHDEGPAPRPRVVALTAAAGIKPAAAQTAISRLLERGLFQLEPRTGDIAITGPALEMFARGNRRIFTPRQMDNDGHWLLVTYSLPEAERATRHQLRRHFANLGGGIVNPGLWIFPHYLSDEVGEVLAALGARHYATQFTTGAPHWQHSARHSAQTWWDLQKLAAKHARFLDSTDDLLGEPDVKAAHAYRNYVQLIDAWRAIPYLDPGLPSSMLPDEWPGSASRNRFLALSQRYEASAREFARKLSV